MALKIVAKETWRVGQPLVVDADSPIGRYATVFEDDGEAGCFYAVDTDVEDGGIDRGSALGQGHRLSHGAGRPDDRGALLAQEIGQFRREHVAVLHDQDRRALQLPRCDVIHSPSPPRRRSWPCPSGIATPHRKCAKPTVQAG